MTKILTDEFYFIEILVETGGLLRQKSDDKFSRRKVPESSHGIGNLELFDDGRVTRRQNTGQ